MSGGQTLKFLELSEGNREELKEKKKGIEIEIDVAGPKETVTRTIELSLDNRGLIKLRFKEGGKLPALLQGRFTDMDNIKTVLAIWQDREGKKYTVNDVVSRPEPSVPVNTLVDQAVAEGEAPQFDEPLDAVLADAESVDLSESDDIVSLS